MQKRHKNKPQYFDEQASTTLNFVVPFISELIKFDSETTILEIGCAEAGNLKPFLDMGCKCTGIDISCGRIELAIEFYKDHQNRQNLTLICEDIYKVNPDKKYDVIIMRDVIEHIPNQEKFMGFVKSFLKSISRIISSTIIGFNPRLFTIKSELSSDSSFAPPTNSVSKSSDKYLLK